jgi:hypothetical protein
MRGVARVLAVEDGRSTEGSDVTLPERAVSSRPVMAARNVAARRRAVAGDATGAAEERRGSRMSVRLREKYGLSLLSSGRDGEG